jgi:hypothetical protein
MNSWCSSRHDLIDEEEKASMVNCMFTRHGGVHVRANANERLDWQCWTSGDGHPPDVGEVGLGARGGAHKILNKDNHAPYM